MARLAVAQTSFTSGELSPLMAGRVDTSLYANGAEKLSDWAPLAQGGVRIRPGLRHLRRLWATPCRLVGYEFSLDQTYVLAFASGYFGAFYASDGALAYEYPPEDVSVAPESLAPWNDAMVPSLKWAWTGDTIVLVHPDMPPQVIRRTAADVFTREPLAFEQNEAGTRRYQPYQRYAPPGITLDPSGTSGTITITASAAAFTSSQVGDIIRIAGKEVELTAFTSATVVTGLVRETLASAAATADWDEQAFSARRGWPRAILFFDGRLWLMGARSKPGGVWASKVGAWFNFDLGAAEDDDAIAEEITGAKVAAIRHAVGHRHLQIFTDIAEYYVPSSEGRPITPTSIAFRQQTTYGSGEAHPTPFDGATLFVDRTGRTLREYLFVDTEQAYRSDAVSLLSPHLIQRPVELDVLYGGAVYPEQLAFLVNEDGSMAVFHSVRSESIAGLVPWRTAGSVRSVAVVGGVVFVAVERVIGGETVWSLERFEDGIYVDAAASAAVVDRVATGFAHVAGETVEVMSGAYYLGQQVVAVDGTITLDPLDPEVETITAGLGYRPLIRVMPFDLVANDLAVVGRKKRIKRAIVTCDGSMSFAVDGQAVLVSFAGDTVTGEPATLTGDIEVRLLGWSPRAQFDLEVAQPGPVTILRITREVEVSG